MALQCDIIPATGTPYFTTNIEDGVALADEALRASVRGRVSRRHGIGSRRGGGSWPTRSASICIPTCSRSRTSPAILPPFLLAPNRAMTMAG